LQPLTINTLRPSCSPSIQTSFHIFAICRAFSATLYNGWVATNQLLRCSRSVLYFVDFRRRSCDEEICQNYEPSPRWRTSSIGIQHKGGVNTGIIIAVFDRLESTRDVAVTTMFTRSPRIHATFDERNTDITSSISLDTLLELSDSESRWFKRFQRWECRPWGDRALNIWCVLDWYF
jgi:hypothetical protein